MFKAANHMRVIVPVLIQLKKSFLKDRMVQFPAMRSFSTDQDKELVFSLQVLSCQFRGSL